MEFRLDFLMAEIESIFFSGFTSYNLASINSSFPRNVSTHLKHIHIYNTTHTFTTLNNIFQTPVISKCPVNVYSESLEAGKLGVQILAENVFLSSQASKTALGPTQLSTQ
jgi:hypothetical protein